MTTRAERLHLHAHDLDEDGHDTVSGGGTPLTVKDEGSNLSTAVTSIDFVGSSVTATNTGGAVTVTITGGGGSLSVDDGGAPVTGVTSITFDGADVGDNGGGSINVTMLTDHVHQFFDFAGDGVEDTFVMTDVEGGLIFANDIFVNGIHLQEDIGGGGDYTINYAGSPDTEIVFTDPPINLSVIHVNIMRNQA